MLRATALVGLVSACLLLVATAGGDGEPAAGGGGLGRLWLPAPPLPDPTGDIALNQLRRNLVGVAKLVLALSGTALLAWGAALQRKGRGWEHRSLRDGLLAALGCAGFLGGWNFLYLHFPGSVHVNNVFVYYVGAKYFAELGYTRLYECTALADLEAGLGERVRERQITDLESYGVRSTERILAEPERCTRHFSQQRWSEFQHDVGWFRNALSWHAWEGIQLDHGYNPPPSWGLLGTLLASTGPASTGQIVALSLVDPLLLVCAFSCVGWAFGWRVLCVVLLYWGTNHPAEFSWTGGSFLRNDWLAASLIGLCLLRRGRGVPAGFLLGYAALLRLFPVLALLGVALAALPRIVRERSLRVTAEERGLAVGFVLAAVTVVPLSTVVAGGAGAWREFADNTRLHVGTPAVNVLGLKTLLSWAPEARLVRLHGIADPGAAWKDARRDTFASRRALFALLLLGYLVLLAVAVQRQEAWVAALLGLGALTVVFEPACYYTSVLVAFAFLWPRRPAIGVALCALSAAVWGVVALFSSPDDLFTWASLPMLAFVLFATATARRPARAPTG